MKQLLIARIDRFKARFVSSSQWTCSTVLLSRKFIDGTEGSGMVFCRKLPDGNLQYRRATDKEIEDWRADYAI